METSDYIKIGLGAGIILGGFYLYNKYALPEKTFGENLGGGFVNVVTDTAKGAAETAAQKTAETLFGKDENTAEYQAKVSPSIEIYKNDDFGRQYKELIYPKSTAMQQKAASFIQTMSSTAPKPTYYDVAQKTPSALSAFGISTPKTSTYKQSYSSTATTKQPTAIIKTRLPMSIAPAKKTYFGAGFSSL